MLINNNFYIETACNQHREMGQMVCGDVFVMKQFPGQIVMVLCDGEGSGFTSNVISNVMASMAIDYSSQTHRIVEVGHAVMRAFTDKQCGEMRHFITIIKITDKAEVSMVEFGNPLVQIFRDENPLKVERESFYHNTVEGKNICFFHSQFSATVEDRILFLTDGITGSGYATDKLPLGWGIDGALGFAELQIKDCSNISAMSLSEKIVDTALKNDLGYPKSDMSCGVVYFRKPRKLLVCSGPPFDMQNDKVIAKMVECYDGEVIISGGSTSQIISRELCRELLLLHRRDVSGLPPTYAMDGIKLVTEGVLTLGRVKSVLENLKEPRAKGEGIDIIFVNELLEHDAIDFVVGTRINELHQNPNIPIELELRRSVISDIARILEQKYLKVITKRYF